jgi:hypothetical protein
MHLYFTSSHVFALFEHSKIWDPGDGVRNLFFFPRHCTVWAFTFVFA